MVQKYPYEKTADGPLVSVLMSVYSEPLGWIDEAIESILKQTLSDFEFIIINDNPVRKEQDEYLQQKANQDSRIIISKNQENIGLTKSLNVGLKLCRGRYIARMDADDISFPTRFEKQVAFLENNDNIGIVGSWVESFGNRKGIVHFPETDSSIRINQLYSSPFDHPATMMNSQTLHRLDYFYDEQIRYAQDQDLWYRIGKISEFANIQEVLYKHRYNDNQISCKHIVEQQANVKKIRRKLVHDYYFKYNLSEPNYSELSLNDIKNLRDFQKQHRINDFDNQYLNCIVKLMHFSLPKYRVMCYFKELFNGEFFRNDWTLKDFIKLTIKYFNPNSFITSGLN